MKSLIICEGPTDFILLQYYMRKVNGWDEGQESKDKPKGFEKSRSRDFSKDGKIVNSKNQEELFSNVFNEFMNNNNFFIEK